MSEQTFHVTGEQLRKDESSVSKAAGGHVPKDSDVSKMKEIIGQNTDKSAQIDEVKANLPLPEQPPTASDFNSADGRATEVGSGAVNVKLGTNSSSGLREPATAESSARVDGSELKKETQP